MATTSAALAQECAKLIEESENIVALTGAGISTNAGIPDFRGPKGLYVTKRYDAEKVFDIHSFRKDPAPFYEFAKDFIGLEETIKPTLTHTFLSDLEKKGKLKGIITQNIDSLHQKAGSKRVYEMHGSFWVSHCLRCQKEYSYEAIKEKILKENVSHCGCGGIIKPDIVFFGENVKCFSDAVRLAEESDLFFVIGTSCVVYPAASLPDYAGGRIAVINLQEVTLNHLENIALNVQEDIDDFFKKVSLYLSRKELLK
jgi:NAD-dependent deacetylase